MSDTKVIVEALVKLTYCLVVIVGVPLIGLVIFASQIAAGINQFNDSQDKLIYGPHGEDK